MKYKVFSKDNYPPIYPLNIKKSRPVYPFHIRKSPPTWSIHPLVNTK